MKQFTINQEQTAMPVCTDSCVFGAMAQWQNPKLLLDLGTGTGLLALIMAQKYSQARIIAVDNVDLECQQAAYNFEQSPFAARLKIECADMRKLRLDVKADGIICNPPYFIDLLPGSTQAYNHARHADEQLILDILLIIKLHLNSAGIAYVLLPFAMQNIWLQLIETSGLFVNGFTYLHSTAAHKAHLVVYALSHKRVEEIKDMHFYYYESPKRYTEQFKELLSPFYSSLL